MAEDDIKLEEMDLDPLREGESEAGAESQKGSNKLIRSMMEQNYLEYAAYVIKDRAIPDVDDGLKPVQRRILWAMHEMEDGKFNKVANIIGRTTPYHPHGDQSIGAALVNLANKEYFIERQGNFGNIFTGDGAAAARYIEARLSPLGKEVLFNDSLTEFVDNYDGRKKEPVTLPIKIPGLLMLGAEGIAVGMSTSIMPHNFSELLQAQIAVLNGEEYEVYPDFLQGGMIDVSEYERGNGKVKIRARIDIDGRKLIIREIPAFTTTDKLIASIEREVEKNRLKIASINDFTAKDIEIEIVPSRGQDPEMVLQALYAYTDCSISVSLNLLVICEKKPVIMDTHSVIERNTAKLLDYLKRELENELGRLNDEAHRKTLAQIFIENRVYKDIEECKTSEQVNKAVYDGMMKYREQFIRDLADEDIAMLLAIPIRRISLFDINKNEQEIADIFKQIKEINRRLKHLKEYAVSYLQALLDKYGKLFPRHTEIVGAFEKINRREVALNNVKVGWDRKNGYIGTNVKSDDTVLCNEFDHLLCVERKGDYKVINIPDKIYGGKLYELRKFDPEVEYGLIYRDNASGKAYGKRCFIEKFITDKVYRLFPENCRLELFTPRTDAIYELQVDSRRKNDRATEINLKDLPLRSSRARGQLVSGKPVLKVTHLRYLTEEELAAYAAEIRPASEEDNNDAVEITAEEVTSEVVEETLEVEVVETTVEIEIEVETAGIEPEVKSTPPKKAARAKKSASKPKPVGPVDEPVAGESEVQELEQAEPEQKAQELEVTEPETETVATEAEEEPEEKKDAGRKPSDDDENWGIIQPEFGF